MSNRTKILCSDIDMPRECARIMKIRCIHYFFTAWIFFIWPLKLDAGFDESHDIFFSWPKIWFEIIHSSHKLPSISLFFTIMIIWEKPKVVNGALVMPNRHWCIVSNVIWSMFLVRLSSMPKCIYLVHWQFHQVRLSLSTKNECLISSYREDKFQKNK